MPSGSQAGVRVSGVEVREADPRRRHLFAEEARGGAVAKRRGASSVSRTPPRRGRGGGAESLRARPRMEPAARTGRARTTRHRGDGASRRPAPLRGRRRDPGQDRLVFGSSGDRGRTGARFDGGCRSASSRSIDQQPEELVVVAPGWRGGTRVVARRSLTSAASPACAHRSRAAPATSSRSRLGARPARSTSRTGAHLVHLLGVERPPRR